MTAKEDAKLTVRMPRQEHDEILRAAPHRQINNVARELLRRYVNGTIRLPGDLRAERTKGK